MNHIITSFVCLSLACTITGFAATSDCTAACSAPTTFDASCSSLTMTPITVAPGTYWTWWIPTCGSSMVFTNTGETATPTIQLGTSSSECSCWSIGLNVDNQDAPYPITMSDTIDPDYNYGTIIVFPNLAMTFTQPWGINGDYSGFNLEIAYATFDSSGYWTQDAPYALIVNELTLTLNGQSGSYISGEPSVFGSGIIYPSKLIAGNFMLGGTSDLVPLTLQTDEAVTVGQITAQQGTVQLQNTDAGGAITITCSGLVISDSTTFEVISMNSLTPLTLLVSGDTDDMYFSTNSVLNLTECTLQMQLNSDFTFNDWLSIGVTSASIEILPPSGTVGTTTLTIESEISGTGVLSINAGSGNTGGAIYLTGNNTNFTGGFNVSGGTTLGITSGENLGSGTSTSTFTLNGGIFDTTGVTTSATSSLGFTVSGTSTWNTSSDAMLLFTGPVSLEAGSQLMITGGGTVGAFSTETSGTPVSCAILLSEESTWIGDAASLGNAGIASLTPGDSGTTGTCLFYQQSNDIFYGGVSSTIAFVVGGSATLTLDSIAQLKDAFSITIGSPFNGTDMTGDYQGSLSVSSPAVFAANATIELLGGTLSMTENATFSQALSIEIAPNTLNNQAVVTWSGQFSGSQNLFIDGDGTLTLTANNSEYTGSLVLTGGTVFVDTDSSIGNIDSTLYGNGGTIQSTENTISNRDIVLQFGTTTTFGAGSGTTWTLNGSIGQTAEFDLGTTASAANIAIAGEGIVIFQNAQNTYTGTTTILSGTLQIFNSAQLSSASLILGGGTIAPQGSFTLDNAIVMSAPSTINVAQIMTLSGTIADSSPNDYDNVITVTGGGTLIFTGLPSYQGGVLINNATFETALVPTGLVLNAFTLDANSACIFSGDSFSTDFGLNIPASTGASIISVTQASTFAIFTGYNYFTTSSAIAVNGPGTFAFLPPNQNSMCLSDLVISSGTFIGNLFVLSEGISISGDGSCMLYNLTNGTFSGTITGDVSLIIGGTATVTLPTTGMSYTGSTTIGSNFQGSTLLGSTYNGNVEIAAATCFAGGGDLIGNGGSLIVNGSFTLPNALELNTQGLTVHVNTGESFIWSGIISGSGGLTIDNQGTLTLSGVNTYSGATALQGGTLILGSSTALGSGSLAMTGGVLTTNQALSIANVLNLSGVVSIEVPFDLTVSGACSSTQGGGTINVTGSQTLTLLNNLYSGTTNVDGSTLAVNALQGEESDYLSLQANATLRMLSSSNAMFYSTLSIQLNDTSTLTFDPQGGEVVLAGNIFDDTSGIISPSGTLTLNSTDKSTLVLAGNNTFQGGTNVMSGILSIDSDNNLGSSNAPMTGNGGTYLATESISSNRTLTLNLPTTFYVVTESVWTLEQNITGSGDLLFGTPTQPGVTNPYTGGIVLNYNSRNYTGTITIYSGSATVNGQLEQSGDPIVYYGGLLQGIGLVMETQVYGGISPGNADDPLGTFTIGGPLHHYRGSYFLLSVNGETSAMVQVNNEANIEDGATFIPMLRSGHYGDVRTYTVLSTTGGITGVFDSEAFTIPAFFATGSLTYDLTNAYFTLVPKLISVSAMEGSNAKNVANALNDAILWNRAHVDFIPTPNGPIAIPYPRSSDVLGSLLLLSTEEQSEAINELYSTLYSGVMITGESNLIAVGTTEMLQVQETCDITHDYALWFTPFGGFLNQESINNSYGFSPRYHSSTGGAALGLDRRAGDFRIGVLGAYTYSHMTWKNDLGKGNLSTGYVGPYLAYVHDYLYANASLIGGFDSFSGSRLIDYASRRPIANYVGSKLLSHLDAGINFTWQHFTLRPFDRLDYITQRDHGYNEVNAGEFGLHVGAHPSRYLRNELGLQFVTCFTGLSMQWNIAPKLSWVREMRLRGENFQEELLNSHESFSVQGYFPNRNLFAPGLNLSMKTMNGRFVWDLSYIGEFGHGYNNNQILSNGGFVF